MQDSGDIISSGSTLSPDESENEKERDPPPFQASTAEGGQQYSVVTKTLQDDCEIYMWKCFGQRGDLKAAEEDILCHTQKSHVPHTISTVGSGIQEASKAQVCGIPGEPVDPS